MMTFASWDRKRRSVGASRPALRLALPVGLGAALLGLLGYASPRWKAPALQSAQPAPPADGATRIGINLFGLAVYNRQRVFTNLLSQSEWFASEGAGWRAMPAEQLDENGWVRFLRPGQTAPRLMVLPGAPYRTTLVHCRFEGTGTLSVGGAARMIGQGRQKLALLLEISGADGEGAWVELVRTDAGDPVRDIDCREPSRAQTERFDPEFLDYVRSFPILRFLDWQRTNDNIVARWERRSLPGHSSQVAAAGASVEDMVDLANLIGADPWFLMPYQSDAAYIRGFARLVHERLDPQRTVHVELGNEVWNDMFDAARQARREGLSLRLGNGDPLRAGAQRYAQKLRATMQIWAQVFADRPDKLVRVAASQNAHPDLAKFILGYSDTAQWVDALATAPYIWVDLAGRSTADIDRIFTQAIAATSETIDFAARNRSIAMQYGKRFIAYEGGQHLVTQDLVLAARLQRDPRMGDLYRRYLDLWDARIRSDLTLYASTAPISEYGSWGLREYAGQPIEQAPKLAAVRQYLAATR